jgi:HlyD family type I secretion membrane fusion protein
MDKNVSMLKDPLIRLCALVCAVGLGGFLLWSAVAPLDEGVIAGGQLVVRDERKEIAHYEGGIVREIHVREGDKVAEGDRLITLEPVQSEAARDEIAQDLFQARAASARLNALREGMEEPAFPENSLGLDEVVAASIIDQQQRLFEEQGATSLAELRVLRTRLASAEGRAQDLAAQITATESNLRVARDDLAIKRESLEEQLETVGNVQRAEREVLALQAELARLNSERNTALRSGEEAEGQIDELLSRTRREVEEEAAENARTVLALTERLEANEDRLSRTLLTAPIGGVVLGLEANTVGGVIRPGEAVMEIVPQDGRLVALLKLPPTDREAVRPGQEVRAQLSAYKQYRVPRIDGEVLSISADLREDPSTGTNFYEARVLLDPETLRGLPSVELVPGLPVEAFIASGRTRTFLDYLLEPISATIRRGMSFN